jgi:DNA-3-methyladenine glycosylase
MSKLPREFYLQPDTLQTARDLLGQTLVVPSDTGARVSGIIVETEAYLGAEDKAAHSFRNRRTTRTEVIFGEGGHAYVFFVYGMYYQLNVVLGETGVPHCILIRAVEPVEGIDIMRDRRRAKKGKPAIKTMPDKNLTSGPGKLCIALGIDKTFNGEDLTGNRIWIEKNKTAPNESIASGPRVGIDYAEEFIEKPWRFWLKNNPYVSR